MLAGVLASSAQAETTVWLNWVNTGANTWQQWGTAHHLNYIETEPLSASFGCADAQINNKEYFFTPYCSEPKHAFQSEYMGGTYLFAQALNDNGASQKLWAWAGWS
ncbi:MAG TPA: hypothetical protein VNY52_01885 [Solirubrobacteraceae bacterium]|nr:hypothetical protein [Solirubrobacteraceae bacterium]